MLSSSKVLDAGFLIFVFLMFLFCLCLDSMPIVHKGRQGSSSIVGAHVWRAVQCVFQSQPSLCDRGKHGVRFQDGEKNKAP